MDEEQGLHEDAAQQASGGVDQVLRGSEELFELVLQSVADGVYTTDRELRVVMWNKAAEVVTGHRAADVIGRPCKDFLRHTDEEGNVLCGTSRCPLREALESRRSTERKQIYAHTPDRRKVPIAVMGAPVFDRHGNVVGAVEAFQDATREREIDRMKSEIISLVSHELRNPLTAILGLSQLAARRSAAEPDRQRRLETLHGEVKRLAAMVDNLLDLSRIEAGRVEMHLEPLDLREAVQDRVAVLSGQSERHAFQIDLPSVFPQVLADRERLTVILGNLLSNAVKYSPDGGSVTIAGDATGGMARVSIADQGVGIPSDQLDRVFERFHRVDSSSTRGVRGTGLGLAIVKASVEMLGGTVRVESELGKGSTFSFILPLADRQS